MKKLLTIPGGPDPFVVELAEDQDQDNWEWVSVNGGIGFKVYRYWLSDIPKPRVRRFKSAGYMIDDAISRRWWVDTDDGRVIKTPVDTLFLRWFIEYGGKITGHAQIRVHGIPDNWTEEVEVDEEKSI